MSANKALDEGDPIAELLRELQALVYEPLERPDLLKTDIGIHLWLLPKSLRRILDFGGENTARVVLYLAMLTGRPRLSLLGALRCQPASGVRWSVFTGTVGQAALGKASSMTVLHSRDWGEGPVTRARYHDGDYRNEWFHRRKEMNKLKQRYGSAVSVSLHLDGQALGSVTAETPANRPLTPDELEVCAATLILLESIIVEGIAAYL